MKPSHSISPDTQSFQSSAARIANLEARVAIGEKRFDLLFRAYPDPTYVWQLIESDFILVDYNDAANAYTHGAINRLLGYDLRTLFGDVEGVLSDFDRCLSQKITLTRELPNYRMRTTGEVKDMVATFVPVGPDVVLAIIHDVTEERKALAELRKLSSAVEQTADAVFITDRSAVIEYVNPAFEQMTGFSRVEALGNTPRIFKSGKMPTDYYHELWKSILAGEPFRTQTTNRKRSGELFVVEQTITPMKDDEGRVTHFVSVLKDMTERLHLQEDESERRLASIIQKQLFPQQAPVLEGYDIAGAVYPANAISGDYFDYISMSEGTTGFVVADVVDHGMGSALIMAEVRAYLRSLVRYQTDLRKLLDELNLMLQPDLSDSNFITMFMARLDPCCHHLQYANAGNYPAFILDGQGKVKKELRTDGYPIGLFPSLELRPTQPVKLEPGDMMLLLTDGIPEAINAAGKAFGMRRVLNVIRRQPAIPAQELIERLRAAVQAYTGDAKQMDDQTLLVVKRASE